MIDLRYADCPYPMPGELKKRLQGEISSCNSYPSGDYSELKEAIAKYAKVQPSQVVVGNGADEIIDLVTRGYGKKVLIPAPTFSQFELAAKRNGSEVSRTDCMKNGNYEIEFGKIELSDATLIWICNPNNPTGTLIPRKSIIAILESANGIVAVDEAYYEFSGQTVSDLVEKYPNLVIVRSFSKGWGLAGLRMGYAICCGNVARQLGGKRQIFSVNRVAEAAGIEVFEYAGYYREIRKLVKKTLDAFAQRVRDAGIPVLPSCTNFVLLRFESPKIARDCVSFLAKNGVLVLGGDNVEFSGLGGEYVRVVIGKDDEMERVACLLEKFAMV